MTHYYVTYVIFSVFMFTTGAFSSASSCASATAAAASPTHSLQDQQESVDDCFETLKELVALSPHRITDWSPIASMPINTRADSSFGSFGTPHLDQLLKVGSDCHNSARFLLGLVSDGDVNRLDSYDPKGKLCVADDAKYHKRTNKDRGRIEAQHLVGADKLFYDIVSPSPANKQEHLFFHISLECGRHVFLVEKMSGAQKPTWWRTYQSFYGVYTLAEWLGIDPFSVQAGDKDKRHLLRLHSEYGNGKKITTQEAMSKFLHEQVVDMFHEEKSKNETNLTISRFVVKENLRSKLQYELLTAREKQARNPGLRSISVPEAATDSSKQPSLSQGLRTKNRLFYAFWGLPHTNTIRKLLIF